MKQTTQPEPRDEALCALVAQGDRVAEETLVLRYHRLVRICARPYFLAGGDSEDLIQEGMLGLLSAVREFSSAQNTTFRTYAETCIRNRILSAIRAACRDKHLPLNQHLTLETPLLEDQSDRSLGANTSALQLNPEDLLIGREEDRERIGTLQGQLSGFEIRVLRSYLAGYSYSEIAGQLSRPSKAVDNAVQRIRRKIARHLISGDFSVS